MTLNLDALEAVARAATPGPWTINWETDEYHAGMPDKWALSINGPEASDFADLAAADAEHMATFDPPTVLALIAKLREAEAEMHARELHHFEEEKLRAEAEAKLREAEQERDEARWAAGIVGDVARESSGGWQDAAAELHATQARLREAEAVIAEALELIATVKAAGEVPVDVFAIERILARSKPTNQEGES